MRPTPLSWLVWELLFTEVHTHTPRENLTGWQWNVVQRIVKQAAGWVRRAGQEARLQLLLLPPPLPQGFVGLCFSRSQKKGLRVKIVSGFSAFSLAYNHAARQERLGGQKEGSVEVKQCKTTISDTLPCPTCLCCAWPPPGLSGEAEVTRLEDARSSTSQIWYASTFNITTLPPLAQSPPIISAPIPLRPIIGIDRNIQESRF